MTDQEMADSTTTDDQKGKVAARKIVKAKRR